ncbi:phage tail assembly chaperone [Pseudomonas sp. KHB2.9]
MKYYYSAKTNGAYIDSLNAVMPDDAVEISKKTYTDLFTGPINGTVGPDKDGLPIVIAAAGPTDDELSAREREWRDRELLRSDGVVARHRDQVEAGGPTTLTDVQYKSLQSYRSQLRDWPAQKEFPVLSSRPIAPDWLAAQIE